MKLFAVDSSTENIVIIYKDDDKKISLSYKGKDKHGKNIGVLSQKLRGFNINFDEIDVFGVGIGPGSITGLRVGISFVLGLGMDKRKIAVPSTKIIAANLAFAGKKIVVARKARQGYLYGAVYDENLRTLIEPFIETIDNFKEIISKFSDYYVVGDGSIFFEKKFIVDPIFNYPTPERFLFILEKEIQKGNFVKTIQPLYLQKSIAEINFEKKRRGE
ncbi:MAG: tRNA threonylcarbamoyladenosine biosynthesis protein TsaB [Thermosipho sp. (in: thermotogales)]|nr:tRNA threonylcarbamoyladenosine biosynthesis protein TsaB [Thermosipho sp. (in: thermotogales)]